MNFWKILNLVSIVAAGVNTIHAQSSKETRGQVALQALGLADIAASKTLPDHQAQLVDAIANAVANDIDMFLPQPQPATP